jgi:hypothetical protein
VIKCKTCGTNFPKPQRRGRPPVQCDACKSSTKKREDPPMATRPQKPSEPAEPQGDTETSTKAQKAAQSGLRAKKGPRRTGFCGITRHGERLVPHSKEIHALCPGASMACECKCHEGVDIWK